MYKINVLKKELMYKNITFLLFSTLPISIIVGTLLLNLNIVLINLLTLVYCFHNKFWSWTKNKFFKILVILYIYLIFNSIFNYLIDKTIGFDGIIRSLSFLKFILLAFSLNILINHKDEISRILTMWFVVILIVIFDVFFESFFGHNTLGFKSLDYTRIVSFFYDENVVGGYLLAFSFIIFAFLINNTNSTRSKIFLNIFFLIIPLSILITGERSNFIKCIFLFIIILITIKPNFLIINRSKIFIFLTIGIALAITFNQNIFIKQTELFKRLLIVNDAKNLKDRFQKIKYFAHYDAAWNIFKDYPINGVGNKNFRIKCADEKYFNKNLIFSKTRCSTHPHQIHFELLAEQGLIGYFLFFYFIGAFVINNLKNKNSHNNIYTLTLNFYLLIFLIPLFPGGGVFASYNGSLFWIVFSLANYNNLIKKY